MCFHAALQRTVLFGGINPQSSGSDTTWLFDGTTWTAAVVSGPKPAPRTGAKMVYDPLRAACVLVGGINPITGVPLTDTWEFDGAAWTQMPGSTTPGRDFGLAFDAARRFVVRHGGIAGSTTNGETWLYGARAQVFGIGCTGSNGVPALIPADAPRLGEPWSLQLTNSNASVPFAIVVLGLGQIAPVPLDGIGMPGCTAYISPDLLLSVPAVGGAASWSGAIPGQPALLGSHLFAQALSVDPGFNPAWLVASNAVDGLLGR
jgi:hypothetical protein